MFTRQWRRALLLISTVLALVAVILLHQCLDKNIFKLDVALKYVSLVSSLATS